MPYGGLAAMHDLAHSAGLVRALDERLDLFKFHFPYFESDHVLNIAYNVLCGGRVLDDIEVRRNDVVFLDALGARAIPDPTTAGDFCRRFGRSDIWALIHAINDVRVKVWKKQPAEFLETACIDVDGTIVGTTGECKQGMDMAYNGTWGYHPQLVSLANTGEPLFIVNRPGNETSSDGAAPLQDAAIRLCLRAGFRKVRLRGDTAFSQASHLDRWDDQGVDFVFGYPAVEALEGCVLGRDDDEFVELIRKVRQLQTKPRAKQPRVKEQIVHERGYKNIRLLSEEVVEFDYQPSAAAQPYRIVALVKNIREEQGQQSAFLTTRYFFYITNDYDMPMEQVVREANDRCNQEKLIEQLKNGPRALRAPLNTLNANWAYMVIASLAWTLKAWFALLLPVSPRWRQLHNEQRQDILKMEFATFVQRFMLIPVQVVSTARQLVLRFLAWRPDVPVLLRLADALNV
jgi:hypothetical protein